MRKQKNEKENKPWDTEHVSTMSRVAYEVLELLDLLDSYLHHK